LSPDAGWEDPCDVVDGRAEGRVLTPGERLWLPGEPPVHTDTCIELLRGNAAVLERRSTLIDEVVTTWITACEEGEPSLRVCSSSAATRA